MAGKNTGKQLSVAEQCEIVGHLRQGAMAYVLGVTGRSLRDTPQVPRRSDSTYDAARVVSFYRARDEGRFKRVVRGDGDGDPLMVGVEGSVALEEYRRNRAAHSGMDLDERRKALIPREEVHETLAVIASALQNAGERLQREFGLSAQGVLDDAIDGIEWDKFEGVPDGSA